MNNPPSKRARELAQNIFNTCLRPFELETHSAMEHSELDVRARFEKLIQQAFDEELKEEKAITAGLQRIVAAYEAQKGKKC